jgi:thiol-disulfide isomerase/thioredoxin
MSDLLILLVVVAATVVAAWWLRRRRGRLRRSDDRLSRAELTRLGAPAGVSLLLQFTAPGCRPCEASWRVLESVAGERTDVAVHAIDVSDAPDVARAHRVLRAPTVLVVAADGSVRARTSGVPNAGELVALLDEGRLSQAA